MDRRNAIKLTLTGAAALALDPTGLLRRRAADAVEVTAEEWEGFLVVKPGSARPTPNPSPTTPGLPLAFEGPNTRGETIELPSRDGRSTLLGRLQFDDRRLTRMRTAR
jgi:hypothetical protein